MLAALFLLAANTMAWDATPNAAGYLLCWSRSAHFWTLACCADVGDVTSVSTAAYDDMWGFESNNPQRLYFQVYAYDATGQIGDGPTIEPDPLGVCP